TSVTGAAEILVLAAQCFNAMLAAVNAHLAVLTSTSVIASEVAIVGAAHIIALSKYRREMDAWYALAGILVLIALLRSLATGQMDIKFLRDVLLIPTFVILGMVVDSRQLNRAVLVTQAIVLGLLFLEAFNVALYAEIFKIQDYYINTRGLQLHDFWNT